MTEDFSELSMLELREAVERYRSDRERRSRVNTVLDRVAYVVMGISLASGIAIFASGLLGYVFIQPPGYALGVLLILAPASWAAFKYMEPESISFLAKFIGKTALLTTPFGRRIETAYEKTIESGRIDDLQKKITELEDRLAKLTKEQGKPDYTDLTDQLTERVYKNAASELVLSVEKRLNSIEKTDLYTARHAMESIAQTRMRMAQTLTALNRRGAINVIIGGCITSAGAALLYKFVLIDVVSTANPIAYALHFAPRLAIVGLVQVFALFFLKLYKVGLEEIKYFQNEMTNIEQRELALSVSLLQDDTSVRSSILQLIAATDRNNVLEKGQSTIELEKAKIENSGGTVETLKSIIPLLIRQK